MGVRCFFPGRRARRRLAVAGILAVLTCEPLAAQRKPTASDTLSRVQTDLAYSSLVDGQPGAQGRWTLQFNIGRMGQPDIIDPVETFTSLQYTGESTWFMRNILLGLVVPLRLRPASGRLGRPVIAWQQRWVADTSAFLTVATLLEYELQTRGEAGDAAAAATGVLVKKIGPGNLFLNVVTGWSEAPALTLGGGRIGYNWWRNSQLSFIVDYEIIQFVDSRPQSVMEAGVTIVVSRRVSIGPGVLIGLSRNRQTPRSGAGVRIVWVL